MTQLYLKKLKLVLPKIDPIRLKGEFFEGYGDTFRQYFIKDRAYLDEIIKNRIQFTIEPNWTVFCEVSDNGVGPHSDQCTVSLNYYIDPAGCITTFWKTKNKSVGNIELQLRDDGTAVENDVRTYNVDDLMPAAVFIAKEDDAYLLNIKQIHSTTKFISNSQSRKILRWMWDDQDFETVFNSIKILD